MGDNHHCDRCGNDYSKTYRKCPFCQEEAAERRGHPMYRHGKRLSQKERSAGAMGVIRLVLLTVLVLVVGVFTVGEDLAERLGIRTAPPVTSTEDQGGTVPSLPTDDTPVQIPDSSTGGGTAGEDTAGGDTTGSGETTPPVEPTPLSLDQTAITIAAGETARINAAGGSAALTWSSSNNEIATVDGGSVTGVAGGTVTITATDGTSSVTCTVTITGTPWVSSVTLSLNKTDFTLRSGDPPFTLKVKGEHGPVTWSSSNTAVATVSADGVVARVGKGNATITAQVDGQTLTCIVRVAG